MKIIFFSDIHGNKYSFDSFCMQIKSVEHDMTVFLGDVFGYYYYADYIIDRMRQMNFTCLLGNHDKYLLDVIDEKVSPERKTELLRRYGSVYAAPKKIISEKNIAFLRTLKSQISIKSDDYIIGAFHGTPEDPINGRLYPDTIVNDTAAYSKFDCVITGHTHHKMVRYIDGTVVINPGSLGQQRDGKGCSYIVLDTEKLTWEFNIVDYNREALLRDINLYDPDFKYLVDVLFRNK